MRLIRMDSPGRPPYSHTAPELCDQFSLVEDGIYALGKAHVHSTTSHGSFPNVAFETVPVLV